MPCKGRNNNIYLKKLIHRVIHSLCITKAKDDVLHSAPRPHAVVFPNGITVAERNGVKVYKPDNNDGAGEEQKKDRKKPHHGSSGVLSTTSLSRTELRFCS